MRSSTTASEQSQLQTLRVPEDLDSDAYQHREVLIWRHQALTPSNKVRVVVQWPMVSFVRQGQKTIWNHNQTMIIPAGHFGAWAAGNVLMSEQLAGTSPFESMMVVISPTVVNRLPPATQVLPSEPQALQAPYATDQYLRHYVEDLPQVALLSHEFQVVKAMDLLLYIREMLPAAWACFCRNSQFMQEKQAFRQFVLSHLDDQLTVEELAFLCNRSVPSFKRMFVEVFEQSPAKWFKHQRLEKAARLIREYGRSPSEVYELAGFATFSAFSKAFREHYQVTPSAYINQH